MAIKLSQGKLRKIKKNKNKQVISLCTASCQTWKWYHTCVFTCVYINGCHLCISSLLVFLYPPCNSLPVLQKSYSTIQGHICQCKVAFVWKLAHNYALNSQQSYVWAQIFLLNLPFAIFPRFTYFFGLTGRSQVVKHLNLIWWVTPLTFRIVHYCRMQEFGKKLFPHSKKPVHLNGTTTFLFKLFKNSCIPYAVVHTPNIYKISLKPFSTLCFLLGLLNLKQTTVNMWTHILKL